MTAPTPSPASNTDVDVDVTAATVDEDGQAVPNVERDPAAAALTTDEQAQRDDTPIQPGNS